MSGDGELATGQESLPALGRVLAGRYKIQKVLGEGGMAIVYEGEHLGLGKRVAIKLVQSVHANDEEIVQRFEREARSAGAVESEHIVHVFDVGADPELGLFLVMELLKGEDLARVLARRERLDPLFACGLAKQAALGLEKAHAAGIVHRDLKPANIFLVDRDDGTILVKLVDFGIAKVVREARDARFAKKGITRRGTAIGTPQYMSPEQAQGLDVVDQRTDVFSLGAVLFEAIAGRPHLPERPTYEQTILQLVTTESPRLSSVAPGIPKALDDLIAEMLEKDMAHRVPDMHTVRERLEDIYPELSGSAVKLKSLPPASSPSLDRYVVHGSGAPMNPTVSGTSAAIVVPRSRRPLLFVAGLAIALGGVVGATAVWSSHGSQPAPAAGITSTPAVPPTASLQPPAASAGPVPTAATTAGAESPSAAASPAPSPSPAPSTTAAPGAAAGNASPAGGAARKAPTGAAPPPKPRDQVGAAGISSQF